MSRLGTAGMVVPDVTRLSWCRSIHQICIYMAHDDGALCNCCCMIDQLCDAIYNVGLGWGLNTVIEMNSIGRSDAVAAGGG